MTYRLTPLGHDRVMKGRGTEPLPRDRVLNLAAWMTAWVLIREDGHTRADFIQHGLKTITYPDQKQETIDAAHLLIHNVDDAIAEAVRKGWIQ